MPARRYLADWVLPVSSPPIRRGAVSVSAAGTILEVGARDELATRDEVETVDLGAALLLPGLVNAHVHAELAGFRGLLEDLPFHQWIPRLRRIKLGAAATPEELEAAALLTCAESLAAGVTCFGATEDSAAAVSALRASGMRGLVYREVFGPDPLQAESALAGLAAQVEELRALETELVRVGVSPHAPYTVSDPLYRAVAEFAGAHSLPIAVHAAEAEAEELLVKAGEGAFAAGLRSRGLATPARARSTVELLARTGILAHAPLIIHGIRLDARDIELLAEHGASVAHCPVANARLGHGIAPVVELRAAGVNVALGTDSVASNNRLDLLEEARVAQLLQRARLQVSSALASPELLELATLAGARALGVAGRTGSLEAGKDADLCAVRIDRLHTEPVHDPLATLFHAARGSDVILTAVRGRILYRDGSVQGVDVTGARERLRLLAERLRAARDDPP